MNVVCGTSTSSSGTAGAATSSAVWRSAAAAPCTCARSSCQTPRRAHSAAAASSRTSSSSIRGRTAARSIVVGGRRSACSHAGAAAADSAGASACATAAGLCSVTPHGTSRAPRPAGTAPGRPEPPTTPLTCAETVTRRHRTFGVRSPTPPAPMRGVRLYDKWARARDGRTNDPRPRRAPDGRLAPRRWQAGSTTGERDEHDDVGTQHVADRERLGGRRRHPRPHRQVVAGRELPVGRPDLPARTTRCCASRSPATTSSRGCSGTGAPRPGLNFLYAHLNRAIAEREQSTIYVTGPGHGGPGLVASAYLDGTYSEVYSRHHRGHRGHPPAVPAVLVPRRHPEPRRPRDPGLDPRGRRARLRAEPRLRRRVRQPGPARRGGRRRRRGRDRAAGHQLALEQVRQPREGRRRPADPAPQRLQDRQPDGARAHPRGRAARRSWSGTATSRTCSSRASTTSRTTSIHRRFADAARRGARRDRGDQAQRARGQRAAPAWPMIVFRTPKGWTGPD